MQATAPDDVPAKVTACNCRGHDQPSKVSVSGSRYANECLLQARQAARVSDACAVSAAYSTVVAAMYSVCGMQILYDLELGTF